MALDEPPGRAAIHEESGVGPNWLKWFSDFHKAFRLSPYSDEGSASGDTTLLLTDGTIYCTGTITLTLPTAADAKGKSYMIKNTSTGVITVDGNGDTIDDETTQTLYQYDCMLIRSDGTEYWIL